MGLDKQFFSVCLMVTVVFYTAVLTPSCGAETEWIILHDNIASSVERIPVTLNYTPSESTFYTDSKQNIRSVPIEHADADLSMDRQLDLGRLVDGNRYTVRIQEPGGLQFISRNSEQICRAQVLRQHGDDEPQVVKEGLYVVGRDIRIPLNVAADKLHIPFDEPLAGELEISIYGNRPDYEARTRINLNGSLAGSSSVDHGLLTTAVTCQGSADIHNSMVMLTLKRLDERAPAGIARGRITDILKLGTASLAVEKIASDKSELVLAVLDGTLDCPEEAPRQQDSPVTVGKPFPAFARVDLVNRELLTLDDLISQAGPDGAVVLIWGDFKQTISPYFGGPPQPGNLPLDAAIIEEILRKDLTTPVVIGFVCRRFSLADLYEKWLGQTPGFHILSDFSNPLDTQFYYASMEPHMFNRPSNQQTETLRGTLNFNPEAVVTAVIASDKKTLYVNPDAAKSLADSLTSINRLLQDRTDTPADD